MCFFFEQFFLSFFFSTFKCMCLFGGARVFFFSFSPWSLLTFILLLLWSVVYFSTYEFVYMLRVLLRFGVLLSYSTMLCARVNINNEQMTPTFAFHI